MRERTQVHQDQLNENKIEYIGKWIVQNIWTAEGGRWN